MNQNKVEAAEPQSPIAAFCGTLKMLGDNRLLITSLVDSVSNWQQTLDDIHMLTSGGAMGFRSHWVRRTAAPVWEAGRLLYSGDKPDVKGALARLKTVNNVKVRERCLAWMLGTYNVQ